MALDRICTDIYNISNLGVFVLTDQLKSHDHTNKLTKDYSCIISYVLNHYFYLFIYLFVMHRTQNWVCVCMYKLFVTL